MLVQIEPAEALDLEYAFPRHFSETVVTENMRCRPWLHLCTSRRSAPYIAGFIPEFGRDVVQFVINGVTSLMRSPRSNGFTGAVRIASIM